MFVQHKVHELWALIYNAVEIKFIIIFFFLLRWPFLCPHVNVQGKRYSLIDVPVHGKQTEPNPIFIACFSHDYDRLNKHL